MKKMLMMAAMLFAGVSAWAQWTGPYKLSLPKNNFRIATERFSESGQLEAANVYAMIGDTYCFVEAHPGENTLYEKYDYTKKQGADEPAAELERKRPPLPAGAFS